MDKEKGDRIRAFRLDGVKVDEDYKRYYPYDSLASKVLGFTGGDNQGIIGLEVVYEKYLKGPGRKNPNHVGRRRRGAFGLPRRTGWSRCRGTI